MWQKWSCTLRKNICPPHGIFSGFIGETTYADEGTASRFFYSTKSSVKERTHNRTIDNDHPTVKNLELMKYLVKLITPKEGIVYDPFAGSGTTLVACVELEFSFVGCELEQKYVDIANERISKTNPLREFFPEKNLKKTWHSCLSLV